MKQGNAIRPTIRTMRITASLALALALATASALARDTPRPNVLWIYVEDMNDWLGCYGHDVVKTPHIDKLAARGVRFTRAYMPAPVCSATRSAVITGTMQTTLGVHNHRSARATFRGQTMGPSYDAIRLPKGVRTVPELFKAAGYYTFNQGKTDYNFVHDTAALYDMQNGRMNLARVDLAALWAGAGRAKKPFFGQIQLRGGKHRPQKVVDRSKVVVPPYYPDIPIVREEIAHHYDCVRQTDNEVGVILASLEKANLLSNTVVLFVTDHGFRMHRHKQFLYEGGIRVPLIIGGPGIAKATRDDLVNGIDIAATSLACAGIDVPASMQGRDLFAREHTPRTFTVAARDRCDYTIERIRAIVTQRYKYMRNYLTDRPYMQPQYRDAWPVTKRLRQLAATGKLNPTQLAFYGNERPREELYDLVADPHETKNLASEAAHAETLAKHRALLAAWIEVTKDQGQQTESIAGLRSVLRRWGDKCVNPEYAAARAQVAEERTKLPRVLILGDSISMGYTPIVRNFLDQKAWVVRPRGNCAGTNKGIKHVDNWLALEGGKWDVIWFNFGLHDLKRVHPKTGANSMNPAHPRQAEPDRYEGQLRAIAKKLAASGAKVVFCTTTPVPEGVRPYRDTGDPQRYNAIARRIMDELGIQMHDLYAFAKERQNRIQQPRNVHFSPRGSRALGRDVTRRITELLPRR